MRIVMTRRASITVGDGINIFLFSLADELLRQGHEVVVISSSQANTDLVRKLYSFENVPEIVSLTSNIHRNFWSNLFSWVISGPRAISKVNPDVVIINGVVPALARRYPTIVVSHDVEIRGHHTLQRTYKRLSYRAARAVVATSTEIKAILRSTNIVPDARVIPTCVSLENYYRTSMAMREPAILHVGTAGYKQPQMSLQVLEKLPPEFSLYMTGPVTQELAETLAAMKAEERKRVYAVGSVDAAGFRRLLSRVLAVVVPSKYEVPVLSPTVLEAFASATPVVASSISADLLKPGVNGYTFENPHSCADLIVQLQQESDVWKRLSYGASQTARQFSTKSVADQYIALARSIVS